MKSMRELVKSGYDTGQYAKSYGRVSRVPEPFEKSLCDQLLSRLKPQAKILDLGCGVGLPFDAYFVNNGFKLTGVDISSNHISQAKKNVKKADFILGDFFTKDVKGKFDAIVSFFAIFHIPRTQHQALFEHIHSLLKKNGLILLSVSIDSTKFSVNKNFAGAPMAWSSFGLSKTLRLISQAGFQILICAHDYRSERHAWVLAKKL